MAGWVKCTDRQGKPVFLNMATAISVFWNDHEECTIIAYPGDDADVLRVREKPEAILKGEAGRWYAN